MRDDDRQADSRVPVALRRTLAAVERFVAPVVDVGRLANAPRGYARFASDLRLYRRLAGDERIELAEAYPQIHDRTPTTAFDRHYFNQDVWAARRVAERGPARHVDVGSRVDYVGFLTALTEVVFVDIRPLDTEIDGLTSVSGSVLDLPFEDGSVESLSCLHVVEHVGLGRYGDPLDPQGTVKAIRELQRVVAPGGQLLLSLPVGRPRTCFNAHRIHAPGGVLELVPELELVEFAGIDDAGRFRRHVDPADLADQSYACGLFQLTRA